MKQARHIKEANDIGGNSYELLNYSGLRRNASSSKQIEALLSDQRWQRMHHEEVSSTIDDLIADIERTSNPASQTRPAKGE